MSLVSGGMHFCLTDDGREQIREGVFVCVYCVFVCVGIAWQQYAFRITRILLRDYWGHTKQTTCCGNTHAHTHLHTKQNNKVFYWVMIDSFLTSPPLVVDSNMKQSHIFISFCVCVWSDTHSYTLAHKRKSFLCYVTPLLLWRKCFLLGFCKDK